MKPNKIILLSIMVILISAFANADLPTGLEHYWAMENTSFLDSVGTNDGTNVGAVIVAGKENNAGDFERADVDYVVVSELTEMDGTANFTLSAWVKFEDLSQTVYHILGTRDKQTNHFRVLQNGGLTFGTRDTGGSNYHEATTSAGLITVGTFYHVVFTYSTTTGKEIFVNNVGVSNQTDTPTFYASDTLAVEIGGYGAGGNNAMDGLIDEMGLWTRQLTRSEITDLYNTGTGSFYPFATPSSDNFTITAMSSWSNVSITNFSVEFDGNGTIYNTTTGTLSTSILQNDTNSYNITISSNNFFSKNYNEYNVSINLNGALYQNIVNITPQELFSNNTITNFSILINNSLACNVTGYYCVVYPDSGPYTIKLLDNQGDTYHTTSTTLNLTTLENITKKVFGHSHEIFVYARTIDNITINNFEATLISLNRTDRRTLNTTTGVINFDAIHDTYNIIVNATTYALYNNEKNVSVSTGNYSLYYYLQKENSIDISLYDETTGLSLNGTNITVTKIFGATQQVNITNTGAIGYSLLTAGNYSFNFEGVDYPQRSYNVEIGEQTYQTLNVYLLANTTDKVIFTFQQYNNNLVIEGVTLQISKIINGTDTLIAVLNSDITGRTQFYFDTTERYCFTASKTSFTTKTWCLDPIIFTSYLIKLETSVSLSTGDDYEEILIDWTPKQFWNNQNNTITFKFATPDGSLTNYGFNATLDNGTTISSSGTNAYGEVLSNILKISNSQYGDKVTIYYYYKKSGDADYRTFKLIYDIYGYNATTDSLLDNPPDDYGLGEFEKTLISVSITVLVAGASALFGGAVAGGVMALFMFAWLMYIAFLNFWVGIISIILLFIIVSWRSTQ